MASRFLLLLLPALAVARINIEISGSMMGKESDLKVAYTGFDTSVISDVEARSFKLNDNTIKDAAMKYFGARPDDAYLRSPTPWGDLYQSYGWEQVSRTLRPISAKVLKISAQPAILLEQIFENNSSRSATFNVGISQTVSNTIASSWTKGGELSVGLDITYEFDIDVLNIGASTSLSYTSSWGYTMEKSEEVTVGASAGLDLVLEPHQSVKAELHATRGKALVEIEYLADLSGKVAVNYNEVYKGHHFWSLSIEEMMKTANMENKMPSKEVIEIGFFSDAKIMVHDRAMKTMVLERKF